MLDMTYHPEPQAEVGHPNRIIIRRITEVMMHVYGDGRDEGSAGLTGGDDPAGQEQGNGIRPAADPNDEWQRTFLLPFQTTSPDELFLDMPDQGMPSHLQGQRR